MIRSASRARRCDTVSRRKSARERLSRQQCARVRCRPAHRDLSHSAELTMPRRHRSSPRIQAWHGTAGGIGTAVVKTRIQRLSRSLGSCTAGEPGVRQNGERERARRHTTFHGRSRRPTCVSAFYCYIKPAPLGAKMVISAGPRAWLARLIARSVFETVFRVYFGFCELASGAKGVRSCYAGLLERLGFRSVVCKLSVASSALLEATHVW